MSKHSGNLHPQQKITGISVAIKQTPPRIFTELIGELAEKCADLRILAVREIFREERSQAFASLQRHGK